MSDHARDVPRPRDGDGVRSHVRAEGHRASPPENATDPLTRDLIYAAPVTNRAIRSAVQAWLDERVSDGWTSREMPRPQPAATIRVCARSVDAMAYLLESLDHDELEALSGFFEINPICVIPWFPLSPNKSPKTTPSVRRPITSRQSLVHRPSLLWHPMGAPLNRQW